MRILGIVLGLCLSFTGVAFTGVAQAQMITAVSHSPAGDVLLVAGDNRVLYSLDPVTLEVTDRRHVPGLIRWLGHSADGRTVFFRTDDRVFEARSAGSFKLRYSLQDISQVSHARDANRIALMENGYKGGVVHLLQAENGKSMMRVELLDIKTDVIALNADASRALILTKSAKSESEPNESPPGDLKGHDKYLFQQQKDGYVSTVIDLDLKAGTFKSVDTFYRVSFPAQVTMMGGRAAILNGRHDSALLTPDGTTQLINMGKDYVAAARISADGTTMMLTSANKVAFHDLSDGAVGLPKREAEADKMPGPAERVTAFDEAPDGTVYFGTSAYRLWKIAPDATEIEAIAVY